MRWLHTIHKAAEFRHQGRSHWGLLRLLVVQQHRPERSERQKGSESLPWKLGSCASSTESLTGLMHTCGCVHTLQWCAHTHAHVHARTLSTRTHTTLCLSRTHTPCLQARFESRPLIRLQTRTGPNECPSVAVDRIEPSPTRARATGPSHSRVEHDVSLCAAC